MKQIVQREVPAHKEGRVACVRRVDCRAGPVGRCQYIESRDKTTPILLKGLDRVSEFDLEEAIRGFVGVRFVRNDVWVGLSEDPFEPLGPNRLHEADVGGVFLGRPPDGRGPPAQVRRWHGIDEGPDHRGSAVELGDYLGGRLHVYSVALHPARVLLKPRFLGSIG